MEAALLNQLDGFEISEHNPELDSVQNKYERPTISSQLQGRRKIVIITGLSNRVDPRSKTGENFDLDKINSEMKKKFAVGGCVKLDKETKVTIIQLQGDIKHLVHQYMVNVLKICDKEILITGV
jgi:translation initiation factor 1 (eIF-1/SUI1)